MHGHCEPIVVHLSEQIVVVHSVVFVEIVDVAHDRVSMRSSPASDEIGDSSMLMTFVVMNVPVEHDKTRPDVLLLAFEIIRQHLFGSARGMAASEGFIVGGTGVRRVMEYQENEIDG